MVLYSCKEESLYNKGDMTKREQSFFISLPEVIHYSHFLVSLVPFVKHLSSYLRLCQNMLFLHNFYNRNIDIYKFCDDSVFLWMSKIKLLLMPPN